MSSGFRCSAAAARIEEPSEGTASTVRAFLAVEDPGPWGVDAVVDSRLPQPVRDHLARIESTHRVRPLLIRRHGRAVPRDGVRVFAGFVHSDRPWLETAVLDDVAEVTSLDVAGLGQGRSPGLTPHDEPVFLVCTHGRHDVCCAERGRPLASALTVAAPEHTWEVSHIGGDRFAANLLVLPHGLYYGRLTAADAPRFAVDHLAGRLDLAHLRGRSSYPFSVQAAEIYLRRHLEHHGIEPMELRRHHRHGTQTTVVFAVSGREWRVRVHTELGEPRQLTCRAPSAATGFSHRLVDIRG